jgi:ribonuclease T1
VSFSGSLRRLHALHKLGIAFLVAAGVAVVAPVGARPPPALLQDVAYEQLPPEAQETDRLIRTGGPFPHAKDGTVFGNRERLLPGQARGYYREYTVRTPGARDRGARRIVCGGRQPTQPDACYYTEDHYASFRRIVQ